MTVQEIEDLKEEIPSLPDTWDTLSYLLDQFRNLNSNPPEHEGWNLSYYVSALEAMLAKLELQLDDKRTASGRLAWALHSQITSYLSYIKLSKEEMAKIREDLKDIFPDEEGVEEGEEWKKT